MISRLTGCDTDNDIFSRSTIGPICGPESMMPRATRTRRTRGGSGSCCGPERHVPLCCVDFIIELPAEERKLKLNATEASDKLRNVLEVLVCVCQFCFRTSSVLQHSAWVLRNVDCSWLWDWQCRKPPPSLMIDSTRAVQSLAAVFSNCCSTSLDRLLIYCKP
jgi:hypothetical protein